jgi:hypothetical protein
MTHKQKMTDIVLDAELKRVKDLLNKPSTEEHKERRELNEQIRDELESKDLQKSKG